MPGLTFMDTPGYDPVSATGMVAGGANLLAFTTGRGSLFGSRPVPCLKISTTSGLYDRMRGDIDFDAGPAMSHTGQLTYGTALFEALVDMVSDTGSKSEALGFGTEEIVPWRMERSCDGQPRSRYRSRSRAISAPWCSTSWLTHHTTSMNGSSASLPCG